INVAHGSSLWAGTFDEKFTDVFGVQDAISQKVADALALRLSGEEKKRLTKRYTENVDAYQLYLIGRYHWDKFTPPDIRKGIGFFQQAIDLDPNYALAYFGLAQANLSLAFSADVPSKDCLPQAKAAAMKALEIDDLLAEAHASLAFSIAFFDWDWTGAEREAKRAVALNPSREPRDKREALGWLTSLTPTCSLIWDVMMKLRQRADKQSRWSQSFRYFVQSGQCFCITPDIMMRPTWDYKRRWSSSRTFGLRTSPWEKF